MGGTFVTLRAIERRNITQCVLNVDTKYKPYKYIWNYTTRKYLRREVQ